MTASLSESFRQAAPPFVSPYSSGSFYSSHKSIGGVASNLASATYTAANKVLYFPIDISRVCTAYRFFWVNGTTASTDNIQVGLYDLSGNALQRGASTLASGVSQPQFDNITDFVVYPARYYLAIWCNGNTTHLLRTAAGLNSQRMSGAFEQTNQSSLPQTATFATNNFNYMPLFGFTTRATP